MNRDYFTENISKETLAKLIDETLNYEKAKKEEKKTFSNLMKIVPAVAAVVLVFALVNIFTLWANMDADIAGPDSAAESSEEVYSPNINRNNLFLPEKVEKSFFEDRILAAITDKKANEQMQIYYFFRDSVYNLTSDISKWEKTRLLNYIYEYTDITLNDLVQMCISIDYVPIELDERYMNVRFGDDYNTLLLEVEWHTYDTYLHEAVEPYRAELEEWKNSDEYITSSDRDKKIKETILENMEKGLSLIQDKKWYMSRTVNGKHFPQGGWGIGNQNYPIDISQYLDSNGYLILKPYPYSVYVAYDDENGEQQLEFYGEAYSKREYTRIMEENNVIAYCDDLLAKGLLTQEKYDLYTLPDPFDYYVELYFN